MEQNFLLGLEKLKHATDEVPEETWDIVKFAVENSFVPKIEAGNFRPLEESDFKEVIPIIEINLKNILAVVKAIKEIVNNTAKYHSSRNIQKKFVVSVILICGEHRNLSFWSSETSHKLSNEILDILRIMKGCNKYDELFEDGDLLRHCLLTLRPKLLKDTFKYYPAAVSCYKWLLFQVKTSGCQLNDPLSYLLPTALILVDDFMTVNQIIGLECIQHIITLTNSTELSWHGEGEMTYKAVEQLLHLREQEVIVPAYSCMVDILKCVEGTSKKHISTEWSKYDNVFEIIFRSIELESSVRLKVLYLQSLKKLLDAAGPRVIRWTKRFLTVLKDYLEVAGHSEYSLGLPTLECLVLYLKHANMRAGRHAEELFSILFRALYDFTHISVDGSSREQTEVTDANIQKTIVDLLLHCIFRLKQLNPVVSKQITEHSIPEGIYGEKFEKAFYDLFSEP